MPETFQQVLHPVEPPSAGLLMILFPANFVPRALGIRIMQTPCTVSAYHARPDEFVASEA